MGEIYTELMDFMKKPAVVETLVDLLLCTVPIWVAVMIGLVIGWSWRPRWTGLVFLGLRSKFRFIWTAPPGFGARRLWFAFTALSAFSVCSRLWTNFRIKRPVAAEDEADAAGSGVRRSSSVGEIRSSFSINSGTPGGEKDVVTEKDLEQLLHLLYGKVGEVAWQNQMERTTSNMIYQAWRLEPESGPIVYRSKTIFEDATPELVRDFFWDDEFRCKWDNMLAYYKILEEFPQNGTMIVHWIKKFPFFCSDREYIIGRRIWESGKTYYCVTKGVPYTSIPKNEKPRRVELYFSSWRIRAVESRKQDGQLTACEVSLVHYEDMGIPKDVAKMGVRHGMWGTVKKLHSGMRAYQLMRKTTEAPLSRCAMMAHITTKVSIAGVGPSDSDDSSSKEASQEVDIASNTRQGPDWKWVIIGGVAIVWGLQTGIVGKTLLFGAARRLARSKEIELFSIPQTLTMANPPPDGMNDDFFDQIFSMPAAYAASGDSGSLSYGDSSASAPGFPAGGPSMFSLGLSLDQQQQPKDAAGNRIRDDDHSEVKQNSSEAEREHPVQLASLFPPYGHSQVHQIRPNPPPQVLHGHAIQSTMAGAPQPPAPRPRVRARRGQATDPHSIAERLRRERIAERIRALQELVPSTNKTDRAAMLDEIVDYVKFLRLQVKVLSMSRLGGAGAVAQLVADVPLSSVEGDSSEGRTTHQVWEKWSTDGTERQVAKLMEEDIGAAMQFLQSKALCIMPVSLAAAIYHTHPQPESSSVKPEPNTPS